MEFMEILEKEVHYDLALGLKKIVKYSLCESVEKGKKIYGVRVLSVYDGVNSSATVYKICQDMEFAKNIIYYLSENGVDDITLKDVIEDLNIINCH